MIDACVLALKRSSVGAQEWAEKRWGDVSPSIGSDIVVALVLAGMTGAFLPAYAVMALFPLFSDTAAFPGVYVAVSAVFFLSLVMGAWVCGEVIWRGTCQFIFPIGGALGVFGFSLLPLVFCGFGCVQKDEWDTVPPIGKDSYFMASLLGVLASIMPCVFALSSVSANLMVWGNLPPLVKQVLRQGEPSAKSPDLPPTPDPDE